jgi:glycosyltransferase involved in cell wall biosynthesis
MKISIVIPCLNAAATIAEQLEALCRQEWSATWEVIVADNGSTDGTLEEVRRYRNRLPRLRIVDASDRRGSAHARNIGAQKAEGESVVFCDADDQVGEGWLAAIGGALAAHDFVASRMEIKKLNPLWLAQSLRNPQEHGLQRISYPPYLTHAGGSGLGVKRFLHEKIGGFDECLPRLEDTDYCFRIQLLGTPLCFVPEAVLHVRYTPDARSLFRQARLWAKYNSLMYKRYGRSVPMADPWRNYFATCRDLLRCVPRALRKETRSAWMKTLGTQIGLLHGSIRFRVPPVR